jgi:HD-like signal output (HDOD) protein
VPVARGLGSSAAVAIHSTYHAGTRQISTLQEAVRRLGMRTIQQMVTMRKRYQEVRARVEQGATFQDAERDVFSVEHADLGARIAEKWCFPEVPVRAMRFHHQLEDLDRILIELVGMARTL